MLAWTALLLTTTSCSRPAETLEEMAMRHHVKLLYRLDVTAHCDQVADQAGYHRCTARGSDVLIRVHRCRVEMGEIDCVELH